MLELLAQKGYLLLTESEVLNKALRSGNTDIAKIILEHSDSSLLQGHNLMLAATKSDDDSDEILALLLARGVNINEADSNGYTALLKAAENHHIKQMRFLLQNGADINAKSEQGDVVFHALAFFFDENTYSDEKTYNEVKAMLKLLKRYNKTPSNETISAILLSDWREILNKLHFLKTLGLRYDIDNLIAAVSATSDYHNPRKDLIEEVLSNPKLSLNMPNKNGDYPLHFVGSFYAKERVEFLQQKGANLNVQDSQGESILMKFLQTDASDNGEVILYLLENGADVKLKNKKGQNALDIFLLSYKPSGYSQGYKEAIKDRLESLSR